ncbi:hypothetical protein ACX80D_10425 [Arthrobacter sp. Sr24]
MSTEAKRRSDAHEKGSSTVAATVIGWVTVLGGIACFGLLIVFGMGHGV